MYTSLFECAGNTVGSEGRIEWDDNRTDPRASENKVCQFDPVAGQCRHALPTADTVITEIRPHRRCTIPQFAVGDRDPVDDERRVLRTFQSSPPDQIRKRARNGMCVVVHG